MNRLATSRPLGEGSEPFLAAKWPTASDEVARGRLVSLEGFPFAFRAKSGEWRDSHLGFQVSFASPWLQWRNVLIPLRVNILNVCVYLTEVANLFTLCESWLEDLRRPEKNKNLFQSRVNTGKGDFKGAPSENIVQNHLNIALLNVFYYLNGRYRHIFIT